MVGGRPFIVALRNPMLSRHLHRYIAAPSHQSFPPLLFSTPQVAVVVPARHVADRLVRLSWHSISCPVLSCRSAWLPSRSNALVPPPSVHWRPINGSLLPHSSFRRSRVSCLHEFDHLERLSWHSISCSVLSLSVTSFPIQSNARTADYRFRRIAPTSILP